eukprot:3136862-Pleurochrysis_carterae.AAC.1
MRTWRLRLARLPSRVLAMRALRCNREKLHGIDAALKHLFVSDDDNIGHRPWSYAKFCSV